MVLGLVVVVVEVAAGCGGCNYCCCCGGVSCCCHCFTAVAATFGVFSIVVDVIAAAVGVSMVTPSYSYVPPLSFTPHLVFVACLIATFMVTVDVDAILFLLLLVLLMLVALWLLLELTPTYLPHSGSGHCVD